LKALEIKKKHYGEDHIEVAKTLEKLCASLEKIGEYKKAKEGYMNVLDII
jgi:hypothetical protein